MKILIQWSQDTARNWVEIDSSQWAALQFRPEPRGGEIIDSNPGWIYSLCVMGRIWTGYDHYAVEHLPNGKCRVSAWIDDENDLVNAAYDKYARVITCWPLTPDINLGGAINTKSSQIVFCQSKMRAIVEAIGPVQNTVYRPWVEFVPPSAGLIAHGIWLPDRLSDNHFFNRKSRGWREWSDGVSADRLDKNGHVMPQRPLGFYNKPDGTKTFNLRGVDQASGIHATSNASFENVMDFGAASESEESENLSGGGSELTHLWTTDAAEPNDAAWPTGNYRCQLDCPSLGADVTFGLRTAGAVTGHFARVNAGLTSDLETKAQTEPLFNTTGLNLATTGSVSWTAGAVGDRFECLVAATRAANHGNQPLGIVYDGDGFADGPWVAAGARRMLIISG